jgi:hypothetical protein
MKYCLEFRSYLQSRPFTRIATEFGGGIILLYAIPSLLAPQLDEGQVNTRCSDRYWQDPYLAIELGVTDSEFVN